MLGHLAFVLAGLLTVTPKAPTPSVLFEPNHGQSPADIAFLSRGQSSAAWLAADGRLILTFAVPKGATARLTMTPLGGARPRFVAAGRQAATLSVFHGRDQARWLRGMPLYGRVRAEGVYQGIDVEYYGTGTRLEYDYIVAPDTDPAAIRLEIDGGTVRRASDGSLIVATAAGDVRQPKPVAYQNVGDTRRPVAVSYQVIGSTVAFEVGAYDRARPLVIDPLLITSTFVGGTHNVAGLRTVFAPNGFGVLAGETFDGTTHDLYVARYGSTGQLANAMVYGGAGTEVPAGLAVDTEDSIYIAGTTTSSDLPLTGRVLQDSLRGSSDGFLLKLDLGNPTIDLSTYFGSDGADTVTGLATPGVIRRGRRAPQGHEFNPIDEPLRGDVYVGMTLGGGAAFMPTTPANAGAGGFVARFTQDGIPLRLQQTGIISSIAVGPDGTPYISANVTAAGLATAGAFQTTPGTSTCSTRPLVQVITGPCSDGYVAHYSADLSTKLWATYLRETASQPNHADDRVTDIAVDASGAVTVLGTSLSTSFPLTPGAFDTTCNACAPSAAVAPTPNGVPFVTRLDPTGSSLVFSTRLNGNSTYVNGGTPTSDAIPRAVAIDRYGGAFVTGLTWNPSFPAVGPPLPQQTSVLAFDAYDAFITAFSPSGGVFYSSRLGGAGADEASDVAASPYATAAIVGSGGADFPMQNPPQPSGGGGFLSIVAPPRIVTTLDAPKAGLTRASAMPIRGWALDLNATTGTGIDRVDLAAIPVGGGAPIDLGTASLGQNRTDVAGALGAQFAASGFTLTAAVPPGQYTLVATAHSTVSSTSGQPATSQVNAIGGAVLKIEWPYPGTLGEPGLDVAGYALDLDASSGIGVDAIHLWAYPSTGAPPIFVRAVNPIGNTSGQRRLDLEDMFGPQFGVVEFRVVGVLLSPGLSPGTYTLVAYAHSTVTNSFAASDSVTITVPAPAVEVVADGPTGPDVYQGFTIGGWAIDPNTPPGIVSVARLDAYAFPADGGPAQFLGRQYSDSTFARPDVAAARGAHFLLSGFRIKTPANLPPGSYTPVLYVWSATAETTSSAGITVKVLPRLNVLAATAPVIQVTNLADGARVNGFTTLTGYAFDPRASSGTGVDGIHTYLYPNWGSGQPPQFMGLASYGIFDPSVNTRFGSQFGNSGFSAFFQLPPGPGTHLLVLYAHSAIDGTYTAVTRLVTVPAAQFQMSLDVPQAGSTVTAPLRVAGWAIDRADTDVPNDNAGLDSIQIYAYPVSGGNPTFVCGPGPSSGTWPLTSRPDVAAIFGARTLKSGFDCQNVSLLAGGYNLVVFLLSSRTRQYSAPFIFPVTVR